MRYFPIFVDLKDRKVIVVGGGEEALRKVQRWSMRRSLRSMKLSVRKRGHGAFPST